MKTQLLIAAGATALLAFVIMKGWVSKTNSLSAENSARHANHHLTNVFAKAKKHSVS